jgi:N-methylhydantoinase B
MYEEGLRIPALKLYSAGEPNIVLFEMIKANVRMPEHVIGDIEAQISANETAGRKLRELLKEFEINDLSSLTSTILSRSESVMRKAVEEIPDGICSHEIRMDGIGSPLTIKATIEIRGTNIHIDYTGTSSQVDVPLNSVPNYTYAYTAYPVRAALCPWLPNNDGVLRPISVSAPLGCLLNPIPPAPVGLRNITGHFLAEAVYGALVNLIPDKVIAGSGSAPAPSFFVYGEKEDGTLFADMFFCAGGMGARPNKDGLSCVMFPANVGATPIEILESTLPILYEEKEFIPNSAGKGEYRGGFGARHRFKVTSVKSMWISAVADRTGTPAKGLRGGGAGTLFKIKVNGKEIPTKEFVQLHPGDEVIIETPGGAGYGNPENRSYDLIKKDIKDGLII